jgi:hypothetical protein
MTQETTAGTYPTTPAAGTVLTLRMTNPVTDMPRPLVYIVRDAAGSGRRSQEGTAQSETRIRVTTPLYFSQASLLLPAFCSPTYFATTPVYCPGLTTFTFDFFRTLEDCSGTAYYTRLLGCTPENLTLRATNSGQGVILMAETTWVGMTWNHTITATDFPDPAPGSYPTDLPMIFEQLAGGVSYGGSSATKFRSFDLSVANTLDPCYDENPTPSPQFRGNRDVNWNLDFRMQSAAYRADFEAQTPRAVVFTLTSTSGGTIAFNLGAHNYLTSVEDELPLDKPFYQKVAGGAFLDPSSGTDLTLTVTQPTG